MSNRNVNLVIVCEDIQQLTFARRYLIERGVDPRRIRGEKPLKGVGSGEQFVRKHLMREVKVFRSKSSFQKSLVLVALIDADTLSVQERLDQINWALEQEGLERIQPDEKIAIFIPKRNIETWIRYANNRNIDENVAYPKLRKPRECQTVVELYVNSICKDGLPNDAPSSLIHACKELAKIL